MVITNFFRLTRRQYFADFFITPPMTLAVAYLSLGGFGLSWLVAFTGGIFLWTLYEYSIHRFALHRLLILRDVHALHHDDQRDYIAMPPWATIASYLVFWLLLGLHASALMVGFSIGYIVYSAMHTYFHYGRIVPGDLLYGQYRRHALHHRHGNVCFGVTSPFWDWAFST